MSKFSIVVTGLPASGKTTLGRKIAESLDIPCLDKDTFLENLFDSKGIGDSAWRVQLSQQSNDDFQSAAESHCAVVLVSHWRPVGSDSQSGTPTEWLAKTYDKVIELYCACSIKVATRRFQQRQRHPGHLDRTRSYREIYQWMATYNTDLPLSLGQLVTVAQSERNQILNITRTIKDRLATQF